MGEELMARMGEQVLSSTAGDTLVALGLGSCIGLGLLDRSSGIAGLAHVMLPGSEGREVDKAPKFADTAVPALLEEVLALGAKRIALQAVLVGGASMFSATGGTLDVGARNEAAVREECARHRLRIVAFETGGTRGRTVRIDVATGAVNVREAGGAPIELLAAAKTFAKAA